MPSPRRRQPAAVRRAQILEAALRCFSETGYHATTMDDVVRASGLSKGSLYWHFRSKEEVFLALFDEFEEGLYGAWRAAAARSGADRDLLDELGEIAFERFEAERPLLSAWIEFLAHPVARERMRLAYRRGRELLASILEPAVANGTLRELPLESVAVAATAAFEGFMLQWFVDPDFDVRRHWPVMTEILRRGAWA